MSERATTSR